jgi:hypothetical protein
VAEESPDSAAGDPDSKEMQQEEFQPAFAGPTAAVQSEMADSDDDGEAEKLKTRMATLSMCSPYRGTSAGHGQADGP